MLGNADKERAQMAAWALAFGEIPERLRGQAIQALVQVLGDRQQPAAVRGQAAEALAEQVEFFDRLDPLRDAAEMQLVETLGDPAPEVRFWSAFGLGKLRTSAALPVLARLTGDTALIPRWWTVAEEAAEAIEAIEGREPRQR